MVFLTLFKREMLNGNFNSTNPTFRCVPTIHQILSKQDARVVSVAVPTTWPPQDINGVIISGFDSPVSTGIDQSFVKPHGLYDELQRKIWGYVLC